MRLSRQIMYVLTAIAMLPLAGMLATALFAWSLGCEVSESGTTPCIFMGTDVGQMLSNMLTMGWFGLLTIPTLMLLVSAWAIVELLFWRRQRRKIRRAVRASERQAADA